MTFIELQEQIDAQDAQIEESLIPDNGRGYITYAQVGSLTAAVELLKAAFEHVEEKR